MTQDYAKRPFAEPELEFLACTGDVFTSSGDPDGGGWGKVWPIG